MGSPKDVQQNSSYLVKRPAISDSANINNINSQIGTGVNLFNNFSDLGVSRIKPSNYNIGSNVTRMDLKTRDVFSVAYGNCDCKYFNTGYDLSDKYNTCNYLKSYQKTSFWDRMFNGLGKALMIGGFVTAGIGLVGGILSLFQKNKAASNPQADGGEEIKVHSQEDIVVDGDAPTSTSELDGLDLSELTEYKSNLESELDTMKDYYANIDSTIESYEQQKESLNSTAQKAKADSDNKQKELGNARGEFNKAGKYQKQCEKAVSDIRNDLDDINTNLAAKEAQLSQMQAAGQDVSALQSEISSLKSKKEESKNALRAAMENLEKAKQNFEQSGKAVEALEREAETLKSTYENYKSQISEIDDKIKSLKKDKKDYPEKIGEKETLLEVVNIKIDQSGD